MRIRAKLLLPFFLALAVSWLLVLVVWFPSYLVKQQQSFEHGQSQILQTMEPSLVRALLSRDFGVNIDGYLISTNKLQISVRRWKANDESDDSSFAQAQGVCYFY